MRPIYGLGMDAAVLSFNAAGCLDLSSLRQIIRPTGMIHTYLVSTPEPVARTLLPTGTTLYEHTALSAGNSRPSGRALLSSSPEIAQHQAAVQFRCTAPNRQLLPSSPSDQSAIQPQ